jgi:glutaredoxin
LGTGIVFQMSVKMSVKKIICILLFLIGLPVVSAQEKTKQKEPKSTVLIVYGSDSCHHCIDTKLFLKNNSINFVFYDIDKDPVALKEMLAKLKEANISTANLGIPVVDKQGQFIINNGNFEDFLNKLKDDTKK